MDWQELNYWNQNSYGSAIRIRRKVLIGIATVLCIITPGTNWLIPFAFKHIKKDFLWRTL